MINDWNAGKLKYYSVPPGIDKNEYDKNLMMEQNQKNKKMDVDK